MNLWIFFATWFALSVLVFLLLLALDAWQTRHPRARDLERILGPIRDENPDDERARWGE